jgi:hypothetical protein
MSGMAPIDANDQYLGDGVYAKTDGYHVWLRTLDGHQIALDPHAMAALIAYERALWVAAQARAEPPA